MLTGGRGSELEGCLGPVVDQGQMIEGYTSGRFDDGQVEINDLLLFNIIHAVT